MSRTRPALLLPALGLNLLISSGTFLVAKTTLVEFPPLPLALLRFVIATAALSLCARWLRPRKRIEPADRGRILLLGILAVPLNQALFLIGLEHASASHAALLYALTPAFVAGFAAIQTRTRVSLEQIAGIALAFAGVLVLMLQRGLHFSRGSVVGDLIILVAVVAWSLYLVAGRTLTRRYGPLLVTARAALAGTIVYLPIGLFGLIRFHPAAISTSGWAGLAYLALLTSAVNYVLWFWGLQYLKPATVALLTNLQPVITVAMAWVFLRERVPAGFALSAALVLVGVWLTQMERVRRAKALDAERPPA
jgi:drug/metabolite transporter (DMT)-like permease